MNNFLKRTGLILMLIAIITASCDEYETPRMDNYKVQKDVTDKTYAGLPNLSIEISKLKSEITSTQTSIAILPESASFTKLKEGLTAINGHLESTIATCYKIAGTGYASQALIEDMEAELSNLQSNIADDIVSLDNLVVTIGSGNDTLLVRLNALAKDNNVMTVKITQFIETLGEISIEHNREAATQLVIDVLNIKVAALKLFYQVLIVTLLP